MIFESRVVSTTIQGKYPLLKIYSYDFDNDELSITIYHNKNNDIDLFNECNYLGRHSKNNYNLKDYNNSISYGLLRLVFIYAPFFKNNYLMSKYKSNYTVDDVVNYLQNINDEELKYIFEALDRQKNDALVIGLEYSNTSQEDCNIDDVIELVGNIRPNLYKEYLMETKLKRG